MDNERARALLDYYLKTPGELKFITAGLPNKRYKRPAGVGGSYNDAWDPDYTEMHDIVSVEEHPAKKGLVAVTTAEGDYSVGEPQAVLLRAVKWKHYDCMRPAGTTDRASAALDATYDALHALSVI